jgi:LysM repeat protein
MEPNYIVKQGDTLSKIAKANNLSTAQLIKLNNIKNPDVINVGQTLNLGIDKTATKVSLPFETNLIPSSPISANVYKVKQGDTLGAIAKRNNISVAELAKNNNISNINKLEIGQQLTLDASSKFSSKELKRLYDTEKLYKGFDESKVDNKQVVLDALKGKEEFILIDKKTNTLEKYDANGQLVTSMRVGLGKDKGDKFTINSKNKSIDRNQTPGGIYSVDTKGPHESYSHDYDNNILLLKSEAGLRQATSIHQIPNSLATERYAKLNDANLNNDDFSNGCVNCDKDQYERYLKTTKPGQKVVILPEEDGNYFKNENGKLAFTTNKNKQYGQYNYTPKDKNPTKLELASSNPTETKTKFIDALVKEKPNLMKDLNLSNAEYDELAKRAYGILGQETNYGEGSWNPAHSAYLEKAYSNVFDSKETQASRSLGLTQIRHKHIKPEIAQKYGITTETLFYPYQAAIATMERLADSYQAVKNPKIRSKYKDMTPENAFDYATTFYNKPETTRLGKASGNNTYVQNVKSNMQELQTKDTPAPVDAFLAFNTKPSFN